MGAWDSLALDETKLKGVAQMVFQSAENDDFDSDRITSNMLAAAKDTIEGELERKMVPMVRMAKTVQNLLDSAVGVSALTDSLQRMLSWAVLMHYAWDNRITSRGRMDDTAMDAERWLGRATTSFANVAMIDEDLKTAVEALTAKTFRLHEPLSYI